MTSKTIQIIGHDLQLIADGDALTRCKWTDTPSNGHSYATPTEKDATPTETQIIDSAVSQITEYLDGSRKEFTIPVRLEGSEFRMKVWQELQKIPYGATISYGELARRIGNPQAFRAVANACGANPMPIIVPCHRVIASGGHLGGYTGGLDIKTSLLSIESPPKNKGLLQICKRP